VISWKEVKNKIESVVHLSVNESQQQQLSSEIDESNI